MRNVFFDIAVHQLFPHFCQTHDSIDRDILCGIIIKLRILAKLERLIPVKRKCRANLFEASQEDGLAPTSFSMLSCCI